MSKAPYGILIEAKLKPGTTLASRDLLTEVISLTRGQKNATPFWAYSTSTGSGESVVAFAPFKKFADLDRPTHGNVAVHAKSGTNVDEVLTGLDSNLGTVSRSLLEYVPSLSNPPDHDSSAPGPHLYHVKLKLKPGNTLAAKGLAEKIAHAHQKGSKGLKYWLFSTALGNEEVYHVFVPFNRYSDIDNWNSTSAVSSEVHGGEQTDDLLTAIDGLIESSERSILDHRPAFSV
jgi:hypothetical protein